MEEEEEEEMMAAAIQGQNDLRKLSGPMDEHRLLQILTSEKGRAAVGKAGGQRGQKRGRGREREREWEKGVREEATRRSLSRDATTGFVGD